MAADGAVVAGAAWCSRMVHMPDGVPVASWVHVQDRVLIAPRDTGRNQRRLGGILPRRLPRSLPLRSYRVDVPPSLAGVPVYYTVFPKYTQHVADSLSHNHSGQLTLSGLWPKPSLPSHPLTSSGRPTPPRPTRRSSSPPATQLITTTLLELTDPPLVAPATLSSVFLRFYPVRAASSSAFITMLSVSSSKAGQPCL